MRRVRVLEEHGAFFIEVNGLVDREKGAFESLNHAVQAAQVA
jgi:hypothetical protein